MNMTGAETNGRVAFQVRLPGFIVPDERGLGDLVKSATSAIGLQPCGGCEKRRDALNRFLVFAPWTNHSSSKEGI